MLGDFLPGSVPYAGLLLVLVYDVYLLILINRALMAY